jgi:hypothetical protein
MGGKRTLGREPRAADAQVRVSLGRPMSTGAGRSLRPLSSCGGRGVVRLLACAGEAYMERLCVRWH